MSVRGVAHALPGRGDRPGRIPDPTFGGAGGVLVPFDPNGLSYLSNTKVVVQSDGAIVIVGAAQISPSGERDFAVARLLADGSMDSSFGVGGETMVPFDLGGPPFRDEAHSVALQPDGKIVVAGSAEIEWGDWDFAVARLNPDGSLDGTFGVGGKTTVWFDLAGPLYDAAYGLAIQPDGKIILVGTAEEAGDPYLQMAAARLDTNGDLDLSFSEGGKNVIAFDLGGLNRDFATDVAIQRDGKIVIAAAIDNPIAQSFAAVRLDQNGNLDGSFGQGGVVMIPFGGDAFDQDVALAVAIQPDDRIVLVGYATPFEGGSRDFAVARLLPDGILDPSFGEGGTVMVPFDLGHTLSDYGEDVVIQADGKIVVAGWAAYAEEDKDFAVVRLHDDGSLDPDFGDIGRSVIAFDLGGPGDPKEDFGYGLALQPDHKIVVAGVLDDGVNHWIFGVTRLTTDLVHVDGFESGDTSAWSATEP